MKDFTGRLLQPDVRSRTYYYTHEKQGARRVYTGYQSLPITTSTLRSMYRHLDNDTAAYKILES